MSVNKKDPFDQQGFVQRQRHPILDADSAAMPVADATAARAQADGSPQHFAPAAETAEAEPAVSGMEAATEAGASYFSPFQVTLNGAAPNLLSPEPFAPIKSSFDAQGFEAGREFFPDAQHAVIDASLAVDEKAAKMREQMRKYVNDAYGDRLKNGAVGLKEGKGGGGIHSSDARSREAMVEMAVQQAYQQQMQECQEIYDNFIEKSGAERGAMQDVRQKLREDYEKLKQRYAELQTNALLLSDGTRAYIGENGEYVDINGNGLSEEQQREAAELHKNNPEATRQKEIKGIENQIERKEAQLKEVNEYLEKHDSLEEKAKELKEKLGKEDITPEEYQAEMNKIEQEKQQMLQAMDPDIKRLFEERLAEQEELNNPAKTGNNAAISANNFDLSLDDLSDNSSEFNENKAATSENDFSISLAELQAPIKSVPVSAASNIQGAVFENVASLRPAFTAETRANVKAPAMQPEPNVNISSNEEDQAITKPQETSLRI